MKKNILLFLIIAAAIPAILQAQVPGYQGKRFAAGYNASSFFYFKDLATATSNSYGIGGRMADGIYATTLSYKTELFVNYTLSRKVTAGFSYYFAKQSDVFSKNEISNVGYVTPVDQYVDCKLSIFELHLQFFRKNFIAPVGLYHQISVALVNYDLAGSDHILEVKSIDPNNHFTTTITGPIEPYNCFKLGYAVGKTNPLGHNFYVNTSIGVNFFRAGDSIYLREGITTQNYILANFNKNLRTHNFMEIKIGLGWLAF